MDSYDLRNDTTEDIQHDLAVFLADRQDNDPLVVAFMGELKARGASIPANCRWEYSPYHRFNRALQYSLVAAG